jgi:hypothetical protein
MKALTLTQPWATLVAIGAKRIETRSWRTGYRGPIAIHAAKGYPTRLRGLRFDEPFMSALWRAGIKPDMPLPTAAVVAVAQLADCIHIFVPPPEPERSFGDYSPGRYAWLLSDVRELREPIPALGALGLWDWEPPA